MSEEELSWTIQSIDSQLSKLNPYANWIDTVSIPLLELRNNILKKYYPDLKESKNNWEIKHPQILKILDRIKWVVRYE